MHSSNLVLTFIQKIHPDLVERYLSGILCYYILILRHLISRYCFTHM